MLLRLQAARNPLERILLLLIIECVEREGESQGKAAERGRLCGLQHVDSVVIDTLVWMYRSVSSHMPKPPCETHGSIAPEMVEKQCNNI